MGLMSKRSSAARLVAGSKNRINSKKRDFMRVPPMLAELERRREYYREGGTESAGGRGRWAWAIERACSVWYHPRDIRACMNGDRWIAKGNLSGAPDVSVTDGGTTYVLR